MPLIVALSKFLWWRFYHWQTFLIIKRVIPVSTSEGLISTWWVVLVLSWLRQLQMTFVGKVQYDKGVIMSAMASQIPASRLFAQLFVGAQIKENIKASRHWPLWGESTGDRWIPLTKGQKCGKFYHLMTSSWIQAIHLDNRTPEITANKTTGTSWWGPRERHQIVQIVPMSRAPPHLVSPPSHNVNNTQRNKYDMSTHYDVCIWLTL